MRNLTQNNFAVGSSIAPEGGVTSGLPLLVGATIRIPLVSAAEGASYAYITAGRMNLTKASATIIAEGVDVYWNDTSKLVTITTTDTYLGKAVAAAGSGSTTVEVAVLPSGPGGATDISSKADKVSSATAGHLASLTADGNLADSGASTSGFAASSHTHPATSITTGSGYATVSDVVSAINSGGFLISVGWEGLASAGQCTVNLQSNPLQVGRLWPVHIIGVNTPTVPDATTGTVDFMSGAAFIMSPITVTQGGTPGEWTATIEQTSSSDLSEITFIALCVADPT